MKTTNLIQLMEQNENRIVEIDLKRPILTINYLRNITSKSLAAFSMLLKVFFVDAAKNKNKSWKL